MMFGNQKLRWFPDLQSRRDQNDVMTELIKISPRISYVPAYEHTTLARLSQEECSLGIFQQLHSEFP